jgi:phosphoribosylformimino-5-aminoimidazole carboxamide ribonucleotide (ProFAR) isomerase
MIVIPAIDLRGGRAVRLRRGDPNEETAYDEDPVAVARRFQDEGARRLHVIDLDAALGEGDNRETVRDICRSVVVPVQVGGGIRSMDAVKAMVDDGAARAILGTAALFTLTLSAPAASNACTSSSSLTPPPTVRGMKTCSAVREITSIVAARPSIVAVMSRKTSSSAPSRS